VLTVGLQMPYHRSDETPDEDARRKGIRWSLSLAHLRYYGHPVLKRGELSSDTSRITFDQFSHAVLGCHFGLWALDEGQIPIVVEIIIAIAQAISLATEASVKNHNFMHQKLPSPRWFDMIAEAAGQYKSSTGEERAQIMKLIKLGRRRCHVFTRSTYRLEGSHVSPLLFGLVNPKTLLRCLASDEDRINYLRSFASRLSVNGPQLYIRFKERDSYALASAVGHQHPCPEGHERWYEHCGWKAEKPSKKRRRTSIEGSSGSRPFSEVTSETEKNDCREVMNSDLPKEYSRERIPGFVHNDDFLLWSGNLQDTECYKFLFGDPQTAALFIEWNTSKDSQNQVPDIIPLHDVLECLRMGIISTDALVSLIDSATTAWSRVLSAAKLIYAGLPGATLSVAILDEPIVTTKWASYVINSHDASDCIPEVALSCIAYLESGKSDVSPDQLTDVFALSSSDSIYISEQVS
jgi:hypothetical protein